jgi:hypothetical protein
MGIKWRIVDCKNVPSSLSSYYPEFKDGSTSGASTSGNSGNSGPTTNTNGNSQQQSGSQEQIDKGKSDMQAKM